MSQCKSVTSDGARCKRKALPGRRYCWQHESRLLKGITLGSLITIALMAIGLIADLKGLGLRVPSLGGEGVSASTPTIILLPTATPVRERDVIYQEGKIVACVSGVTIYESQARFRFEEIYNSNSLDLGSEFEFRVWRLRLVGYESFTGFRDETVVGSDGPLHLRKEAIIGNAECEIVGRIEP